jgi:hypothetical protein
MPRMSEQRGNQAKHPIAIVVERTGLTYMLAENYCFIRSNLMVENMASRGLFGKLTYLEGAYLHDCRKLLHDTNGDGYPEMVEVDARRITAALSRG